MGSRYYHHDHLEDVMHGMQKMKVSSGSDSDIFYACEKGRVEDVRKCLKAGVSINTKNRRDRNKKPLHYAARKSEDFNKILTQDFLLVY